MDPRREGRPVRSPRRGRSRLAAALLVAALVGCAGGAPGPGASAARSRAHNPTPAPERAAPQAKQASPFPSRGEIESLAKRAAPKAMSQADYASVARWQLEGPFPERIGEEPIQHPDAWEKLLMDAVAQRAGLVVASKSMRCAARQLGLFFLAHHAYPDQSLQQTILGRCGATAISVEMGYLHGDVPAATPETAILRQWHDGTVDLLHKYLGAGPRAVGLWFGRRGGKAVLMLASAVRHVRVDPVSAVPGRDGAIHLSGEVLTPAESLDAMINHGDYGFADCKRDASVKLPRFALSCPTRHDDAEEWISLTARAPGRILANPVLRVLARPSAAAAVDYHRPRAGRSVAIALPKDFAPKLVSELNRLRARVHAQPLTLETRESEVAHRVAPLYFGAYEGTVDPSYGDVVALGLMAGWDVQGPIRRAAMGGTMVLNTNDLAIWLGDALTRPWLRAALFAPGCSRIAAGPVLPEKKPKEKGHRKQPFLAGVVSTYTLYGHEDWAAERRAFYARVDREFASRNDPTPRRDRDTEAAADLLMAQVRKGSLSPREALSQLLNQITARLGVQAHGWTLEGSSTKDVPLPDALFSGGVHRLAAAVGYTRPAGSPWARTVVLLVDVPEVGMRPVQRQRPANAWKSASRSNGSGAHTERNEDPAPGPSSISSAAAWSWRRSARLAAVGPSGP